MEDKLLKKLEEFLNEEFDDEFYDIDDYEDYPKKIIDTKHKKKVYIAS